MVEALSDFPKLQFEYLKSIMNSRAEAKQAKPGVGSALRSAQAGGAGGAGAGEPTMSELLAASGWELTPKIEEHYIRLLCQYSRNGMCAASDRLCLPLSPSHPSASLRVWLVLLSLCRCVPVP